MANLQLQQHIWVHKSLSCVYAIDLGQIRKLIIEKLLYAFTLKSRALCRTRLFALTSTILLPLARVYWIELESLFRGAMARAFTAVLALGYAIAQAPPAQPNIVFLLAESTDGRLFRDDSPVPLPNIRKLLATGVRFDNTYANAPVCCPSRGTMFTGRQAHNVPHWHNDMLVQGLWNNYEGLNANMSDLFDELGAAGYAHIKLSDKTDWTDGGHSEDAYLEAWTHNVPFVYNISADGGWDQELGVCTSEGTVAPGGTGGAKGSVYSGDWDAVEETIKWIDTVKGQGPFVAYQGFNIVHPPYATNEHWFNAIDPTSVSVPVQPAIADMHPCDLQSSMLKGCTPANASVFEDEARVHRIRRIYLAEIAEFDAMVGRYVEAIEAAGLTNSTMFVVLADHGDMQMEHRSFYKMVFYEGSVHVPMLFSAPWLAPQVVQQHVQLVDIYPTLLHVAGAPAAPAGRIDGHSLAPFLAGASTDPSRPPWVVSQFHGDDIAASWFMLREGDLKYVAFGAGSDGPSGMAPLLFNLTADPAELVNLAPSLPAVAAAMDATLRTAVDYPSVAADVASYQQAMVRWFVDSNPGTWQTQMVQGRRWSAAWAANPSANLQAVTNWLAGPPTIQACRNATAWPPAPTVTGFSAA